MNVLKRFLTVASAGGLCALLAAPAGAQFSPSAPSRPESTLLITDRTEAPGGVILEMGTYLVRVADNQSNWNLVEITSVDRSKTYVTALTTPHTAKDGAPNTLFTFFDDPDRHVKVLRSWFPANDRWGQDFVYSKARSEELARLSHAPVPEVTTEMEAYTASHVPSENALRKTEPLDPPASSRPMPETVVAQAGSSKSTLPKTASPVPLLALLGATALGAGVALRRFV